MDTSIMNKKNRLIIKMSGGSVSIEDQGGKKGGNIATHRGHSVSWTNKTSAGTCYLKFKYLLDDNNPNNGDKMWPFEEQAPVNMLLEVQPDATETRTLMDVAKPTYVEYEIEVSSGGPSLAILDPAIIIDP